MSILHRRLRKVTQLWVADEASELNSAHLQHLAVSLF